MAANVAQSQPGQQAMSPLVASYSQDIYGGTAANLPRPANIFQTGAFGPAPPIWPMPIDQPQPDMDEPFPRRVQYPVAWNLPVGVPGTEGLGKLAPFGTLRQYADAFSVARSCVDIRKREIVGLVWDIVPTTEAAKAMEGSTTARTDWEKRRGELLDWFQRPDCSPESPYESWESWMNALLEDLLVCDAGALYCHPARGGQGRGVMGSNMASWDLLDGTTIRPMYSLGGGRPPPSAVAYQQFIWGVPRVDFQAMIAGEDLAELDDYDDQFYGSELAYLRYDERSWTPYGQSAIEKALLPISIGLARQNSQLEFYTVGSVPYMFVVPGPELIQSPQQVRQLQNALNAVAGDTGWKQKIVVLPPGSQSQPIKPNDLADQFDEFIVALTTMPFGLTPMDVGITPRVAAVQSPGASNQMAKVNTAHSSDRWLEPFTTWLKVNLFDRCIQEVFHQQDMQWEWTGMEQPEDLSDKIDDSVSLTHNSLLSIDEGRTMIGYEPFGLPETSVPMVFTATGAMPLSVAVGAALQAQEVEAVEGELPPPSAPTPGQGPPKPKPDAGETDEQGEPTTPAAQAHEAEQVGDQAEARQAAGTTAAKLIELEILGRQLAKGKALKDFVPKVLEPTELAAVKAALPDGVMSALYAGDQAVRSLAKRRLAAKLRTTTDPTMRQAAREFFSAPKAKSSLTDQVYAYLAQNYPKSDLGWVKGCTWQAQNVPLDSIDATPPSGGHDVKTIKRMVADLKAGKQPHPVVLVSEASKQAPYVVADGHHRTAAFHLVDHDPVAAWVGNPGPSAGDWMDDVVAMQFHRLNGAPCQEIGTAKFDPAHDALGRFASEGGREARREAMKPLMHDATHAALSHGAAHSAADSAVHSSSDESEHESKPPGERDAGVAQQREMERQMMTPPRKAAKPVAAGLCVRAKDTGRVLMLQRTMNDPTDPNAGTWEFPGGHIDPGETPEQAAIREWQEEVGVTLPPHTILTTWTSPNGVYVGHLAEIDHEDDAWLNTDTDDRTIGNPDDPHGDKTDAAQWFDPRTLTNMSSIRGECRDSTPWDELVPKADPPRGGRGPEGWPGNARQDQVEDHYEQVIAPRLADVTGVRAAVEQAVSAYPVTKAAGANGPDETVAAQIAQQAVEANVVPAVLPLVDALFQLYGDAWSVGSHAAAQVAAPLLNVTVDSLANAGVAAIDWDSWAPGNPQAALQAADGGLAQLLAQASQVIQGVNDTTMDRIGSVIADGLQAGENIDTITARVNTVLQDPARARTIARTETCRATWASSMDTYTKAGILEWEWLAFPGACPVCVANAAGGPYPIGGGPQWPAHPNDRCTPIAVV